MKKFQVGNVEVEIKVKEVDSIQIHNPLNEATVYFDITLTNTITGKLIKYLDYDYCEKNQLLSEMENQTLEFLVLKKILNNMDSHIDLIDHDFKPIYYKDIVEITGQDWIDEINVFNKMLRCL